jgi:hypothetical protein
MNAFDVPDDYQAIRTALTEVNLPTLLSIGRINHFFSNGQCIRSWPARLLKTD